MTKNIITAGMIADALNDGASVISAAQKFLLPYTGDNGAEPLVNPETGEPILDWEDKAVGESGIVFWNAKDNAWQAAAANTNAVIIMNQATAAQASAIIAKVREYAENPNDLTLEQLKAVIEFAATLGLTDVYNSDQKFVAGKMTRAAANTGYDGFGLYKRDDRDLCTAIRLEGDGEFQGPAATPQQFTDGAIIVQQGDSVRLVQTDVFLETYTMADGSAITLEDIPLAA